MNVAPLANNIYNGYICLSVSNIDIVYCSLTITLVSRNKISQTYINIFWATLTFCKYLTENFIHHFECFSAHTDATYVATVLIGNSFIFVSICVIM